VHTLFIWYHFSRQAFQRLRKAFNFQTCSKRIANILK
jgi:hypothetical protein